MKIVKTIEDVQKALNELFDWRDRLQTKDWDLNGLRITGASPSKNPNDYVIRQELPQLPESTEAPDQFYTIVFNSIGEVSVEDDFAPFIVGRNRTGAPVEVHLAASTPPTGTLTVNLQYKGATDTSYNNMLATNLSLNAGEEGPVSSSKFLVSSKVRKLGYLGKIKPIIISDGAAALVTIELVVRRVI